MSRDHHYFIKDIKQSCEKIIRYTDSLEFKTFCADEVKYDAVIRNLEIIGEAANNLSRYHPEFIIKYSQIPWEDMYWMRNRISHGYFSVDFEIVWKTIERDLPILQKQIQQIYDHLFSSKSRFSKTD